MKSTYSHISLLALRAILAAVFIAHGGQKIFGWWGGPGLQGFVEHLQQTGIPIFLAYLAAFTEFFGGIALLIGLLTRLASLGLLIVMAVAVFTVHFKNGFFAQNRGYEYPLTLLVIAFSLLLTGPGCFSLDALFCRKKNRNPE